MPRRQDLQGLPASFTVSQAVQHGLSAGVLRRAEFRRPFHGVRATGSADSSLRAQCMDYAPRLAPHQFFSHETALEWVGAPMPEWPYRPAIHVSAHRPAREPRTQGVVGHRLQLRESGVLVTAEGVPVEHPVRAWRQCGTLWQLDDLIAAGDFLVSGDRPWATVQDLMEEVRTMGDVRGGLLTRALREVRAGVRSARETRLRLLVLRGGLPRPETGWDIFDDRGTFIAEADLAFRRYRVCAEYDGRVHAESIGQFQKDADRWDAIRAAGWDHVRILNHHLQNGGAVALEKIRTALVHAGWTPGR